VSAEQWRRGGEAWPKLNADERLAIYRADPEAIDLAWNGADDATRKRGA
jgi:hypothetical protein